MARSYSINGNATNTTSATLPLLTLISATSVQPIVTCIEMGSDATAADNSVKYVLQRCTTTGTPGSSITPTPLDPNTPACATTSGLAIFSGTPPTLTSNLFLHQWGQNQRQAYRWQAYDLSKGLKMPATASNGLALMCTVNNPSPFNAVFSIVFEE